MTPIFSYASQSDVVKTLIGASPVRFWPFSEAPQKGQPGYGLPYAVHQLAYGSPDNYLGQTPDADNCGEQVDAYGRNASEADAVMRALRAAFEPHGYVVAYNGEEKEQATGLFRSSFTVEFWTDR